VLAVKLDAGHHLIMGQARHAVFQVLRRAIERGEISADIKAEVAIDMIHGPHYHRLLHGHAPLNDRFGRDVADLALNGIQQAQAG